MPIILILIIVLCYLQGVAMHGTTNQNALDRMSMEALDAHYKKLDLIGKIVIYGLGAFIMGSLVIGHIFFAFQ